MRKLYVFLYVFAVMALILGLLAAAVAVTWYLFSISLVYGLISAVITLSAAVAGYTVADMR